MPKRRVLPATVIALILFGGAYFGYWHYAAGVVRDGVDIWIAQRRAEGIDVRADVATVDGFPFALDVELRDIVVARGGGQVAWEGRVPTLHLIGAPWDFRRLAFVTDGRLELAIVDILSGRHATVAAARGIGSAAFTAGGRLRFGELTLHEVGAAGTEPYLPIEARVAALDYRQSDAERTELSARAFEVGVPPLPGLSLGPTVERLAASVVWHGPIPELPTQSALAAWRAGGGKVDISFVEAAWGPLTVSASGEARLDPNLQPTGVLSTTTQGYRDAVTAIETAGHMSPRQAAQTRLMLDLMATRPAYGGSPRLDVDLTLVDRRLSAGAVPLAVMPQIDWPLR